MARGDIITLDELKARHSDTLFAKKPAEPALGADTSQTESKSRFGNFFAGAVDGFSGAGRTIQSLLPSSISTIGGGETANEMGRDARLQSMGADPDALSTKVGEFTGEVGTFIAPGGAASRVAKGGSLLARGAAQGAASFGQESLNQGGVDASSFAAGATDAALPFAGKFLGLGGELLKGLSGGLTGQGVDVIDAAMSRPGAAFNAAGPDAKTALKDLAGTVKAGVASLNKKAGSEYADLVSKAGVKELPKDKVVTNITARLAELADGSVADDGIRFVDTPFTEAEEKQLTKVFNNVKNWSDFTPEGVNNLARKISRFRRGAQDSANFDRVIDTVKRELREEVGKVAPTIKEANELFAEKMDLLDEIDNVLKTDTKFQGREGIRKTAEALGRIFSSGKEFSREAVEDLEAATGLDIIGTIAGIRLSDTAPRAASGLGDTIGNVVRPVASVTSRNLVPLAGTVKNELIDRITAIPGVDPAARAVIVNTFAEFFRDEE